MKNAENVFFKVVSVFSIVGVLLIGAGSFFERAHAQDDERIVFIELTRAIHQAVQQERAEKREAILKRFVSAVAKFDCPDYTHTDGNDVIETFSAAFKGENVNDDWLKEIQERVSIESQGRITVNNSFKVHWLFARHVRLIANTADGKAMEYLVIADHRQSIACSMSEEEKNTQRVFMKVLGQKSYLTSNDVKDSQ
jgi:DNA-binding MarR family transcriptional regulator